MRSWSINRNFRNYLFPPAWILPHSESEVKSLVYLLTSAPFATDAFYGAKMLIYGIVNASLHGNIDGGKLE